MVDMLWIIFLLFLLGCSVQETCEMIACGTGSCVMQDNKPMCLEPAPAIAEKPVVAPPPACEPESCKPACKDTIIVNRTCRDGVCVSLGEDICHTNDFPKSVCKETSAGPVCEQRECDTDTDCPSFCVIRGNTSYELRQLFCVKKKCVPRTVDCRVRYREDYTCVSEPEPHCHKCKTLEIRQNKTVCTELFGLRA